MEEMWINTSKVLESNRNKVKPCHKLGYCPYGAMVEMFPLEMKNSKMSCRVFGHDCPMYYNAEDLSEFGEIRIKEELKEAKK